MGSRARPIDCELVRRWSLYLTWRYGSEVSEELQERTCDAIVRGEEPPDDGWELAMARAEAEEAVGALELEGEIYPLWDEDD